MSQYERNKNLGLLAGIIDRQNQRIREGELRSFLNSEVIQSILSGECPSDFPERAQKLINSIYNRKPQVDGVVTYTLAYELIGDELSAYVTDNGKYSPKRLRTILGQSITAILQEDSLEHFAERKGISWAKSSEEFTRASLAVSETRVIRMRAFLDNS